MPSFGPEVEVLSGNIENSQLVATGWLLANTGLVLTASRPLKSMSTDLSVRLASSQEKWACKTIAVDNALGLALLDIRQDDKANPAAEEAALRDLRWGRLSGDAAVPCRLAGFLAGDGGMGVEEFTGTIQARPGGSKLRMVVQVENPPSGTQTSSRGAWQGFLGAPVYCDAVLVGFVTSPDIRFGSRRLLAVSAEEVSRFYQLHGSLIGQQLPDPEIIDASKLGTGSARAETAENIAIADPFNLQEVASVSWTVSDKYYSDVLQQAHSSFVAALWSSGAGFFLFLLAAALAVVRNDLHATLVSAMGGAVVEVVSGLQFWLYGRAALQFSAFHAKLERMQRYMFANTICLNMDEINGRGNALAKLADTISAEPRDEASGERSRSPQPK